MLNVLFAIPYFYTVISTAFLVVSLILIPTLPLIAIEVMHGLDVGVITVIELIATVYFLGFTLYFLVLHIEEKYELDREKMAVYAVIETVLIVIIIYGSLTGKWI